MQTWWVEPVWKGMTLPRYRVDLSLSDNCGEVNPIGCVVDGTPIFQENFGGNKHSDPNISPVGIGLKSEYEYTANVQSTNFGNNKYTIAKTITPAMGLNQYWHTIYDHTHEADHNMGYRFVVNGDAKKKDDELDAEGLCGGSETNF